jgi:uncharacterized protein (TIRG00374 family)
MTVAGQKPRSKWYVLVYPIAGAVVAGVIWQAVVLVHQWNLVEHAQFYYLIIAAFNQMAVYLALVPAMRMFYQAADIEMSATKTFGLLATGMAMARIIPAGEYLVWRASLRHEPNSASATTQWTIMYLSWMFCGLVGLFIAAEIATLVFYPNAHTPDVAGYLRYLPIILSMLMMLAVLLVRLQPVQVLVKRLAYNRFGSHAVSPFGIIRDRKLDLATLVALTLAAIVTWLIEGFTLYLCFLAIGLNVPVVVTLFAFAFARLFSIIPITPGSIGEIEAGTTLFFAAYSFPLGPIFTGTVLYRFMAYWPPLLVGAIAFLAGGTKDKKALAYAYRLQTRHNINPSEGV